MRREWLHHFRGGNAETGQEIFYRLSGSGYEPQTEEANISFDRENRTLIVKVTKRLRNVIGQVRDVESFKLRGCSPKSN